MQSLMKLGIVIGLIGTQNSLNAQNKAPDMQFQIRDPKTQEVFFHGRENVSKVGQAVRKETIFYDQSDKQILTEDALYDSGSLRMESYTSFSPLTGEETRLKTEGSNIAVQYKAKGDESFRATTLPWTSATYHGKVFDDLIQRNWESLVQGKTLKFDLVLPFRLESRGFQILQSRRINVDGQDREVFALEPQNFLLRALVPKMEFQYAVDQRQLKVFSGPSVIPIKGESNRPVDIVYNSPPVDRPN